MRMAKGKQMVTIIDVMCIYKLPEDQAQLDNDRKTNCHGWDEQINEEAGYAWRHYKCSSGHKED